MKQGDKAKVIGNISGHCFKIGSIVKLESLHPNKVSWYCRTWFFGTKQALHEKDLELV